MCCRRGRSRPGYVLALAATFLDRRRPHRRGPVGRSTAPAIGTSFARPSRASSRRSRTSSLPMSTATIGFIAPGRIPIRSNGNGWLPVPGWTGEYDWTGFIPFADLPQRSNPASGHFVSANNKIVPDSLSIFPVARLGSAEPGGADRRAACRRHRVQSPAASAAIQADTLSIAARRLVPLMTRIVPKDDVSREAIERLRAWDFRMDAGQGRAAAVHCLAARLCRGGFRRAARRRRQGLLGPAAAGHRKRADRTSRMVRRTGFRSRAHLRCGQRGGQGRRRGTAAARSRTAATRCLPTTLDSALAGLRAPTARIWRMAMGARPCRRVCRTRFLRIPVLRDWLDLAIPTAAGPTPSTAAR